MSQTPSLIPVQEATLTALSLVRDEAQDLFQRRNKSRPVEFATLNALFGYQSERNQTVSFLTSWGRVWDAEIILRSFYEASAKILLICFEAPDERSRLCDEFWAGFGNLNARRTARGAKFAERLFDEDDIAFSVFSVLQDHRTHDLSKKYTKAQRRDIERRWSFSGLLQRLSELSIRGKQLEHVHSLRHMYDTASHLAHADNSAIDLMTDRRLRHPEELAILEAAHVCRIWTDQFFLAWFCVDALAYCFGVAPIRAADFEEARENIEKRTRPFQDAFYDSQRDFYASHRRRDGS